MCKASNFTTCFFLPLASMNVVKPVLPVPSFCVLWSLIPCVWVWCVQDQAKIEHEKKMASMREWNEEELRMLDKALSKFPQVDRERLRHGGQLMHGGCCCMCGDCCMINIGTVHFSKSSRFPYWRCSFSPRVLHFKLTLPPCACSLAGHPQALGCSYRLPTYSHSGGGAAHGQGEARGQRHTLQGTGVTFPYLLPLPLCVFSLLGRFG